jgi:two-component system cell cycle response regulator CpdR
VKSLLTILFVEDESDLRRVVTEMLVADGFTVLTAADGIDALKALHRHDVHVLFTDIIMPVMDGVELARRAKLIRPGLKVLFTTGYVHRATDPGTRSPGWRLVSPRPTGRCP